MYYTNIMTKAFGNKLPAVVCVAPSKEVTDIIDRCIASIRSPAEHKYVSAYLQLGSVAAVAMHYGVTTQNIYRHLNKFISLLRHPIWSSTIFSEVVDVDVFGLALLCYVDGVTSDMVTPTVSRMAQRSIIDNSYKLQEPLGLMWRQLLDGESIDCIGVPKQRWGGYRLRLVQQLRRPEHKDVILKSLTRL